jgi:hypothetical protein
MASRISRRVVQGAWVQRFLGKLHKAIARVARLEEQTLAAKQVSISISGLQPSRDVENGILSA